MIPVKQMFLSTRLSLLMLGILPLVWFSWWRFPFEMPKIIFLSFMVPMGIGLKIFDIKKKMSWLIVIWVLWLGVASWLAGGVEYLVWGFEWWQGLWFHLLLIGVYFWIGSVKDIDNWRVKLGMVWLYSATATVMVGGWMYIKRALGLWAPDYDGRIISSLGQPNIWSDYLLVGWTYVWFSDKYNWKVKGLGLMVMVLGLLLSGSRLNWLMLGLLLAFSLIRKWSWQWRMGGGVLVVTVVWLVWNMGWMERRLLIWSKALEAIWRSPWIGYGMDNLGRVEALGNIGGLLVDRAHNVVLDQLLFGGIVAGLVFGYMWWLGFWGSIKLKKREVVVALVVWLVLGSIHVVGVTGWVWLMVLLALSGSKRKIRKVEISKMSYWIVIVYSLMIGGLVAWSYGVL